MTRGAPIPDTLTLHVPFRVVKRSRRKEMHLPEGVAHSRRTDNSLVKALARAFRWKRDARIRGVRHHCRIGRMRGDCALLQTRVLRLTLLSPDIVEAILYRK